MATTVPRSKLKYFSHQVGTINSGHLGITVQASHPNQGHPVWRAQKGIVQDLAECRVRLRLSHSMNTRNCNITLLFLCNRLFDPLARQGQIQDRNAYSLDVNTRVFRRIIYRLKHGIAGIHGMDGSLLSPPPQRNKHTVSVNFLGKQPMLSGGVRFFGQRILAGQRFKLRMVRREVLSDLISLG